jgi:hypothetical protein
LLLIWLGTGPRKALRSSTIASTVLPIIFVASYVLAYQQVTTFPPVGSINKIFYGGANDDPGWYHRPQNARYRLEQGGGRWPCSVTASRANRQLKVPLADAATSPRQAAPAAAAATTTAAAPAAPAATATATATAATTAASPLRDLVTKLRLGALLVEDIEGRQTDVGKLFLAEDDFVIRRGLLHRQIRPRRGARCRRGATR